MSFYEANFECLVQPDALSTQMQLCFERVCGWTRPFKYENFILKNNEIVKGFSKMNSIMFFAF